MMLELIICCFLVFAVAYWVALWSAGRRDDVLHGHFVEAKPETDGPAVPASAIPPAIVFPRKPVIVAPPAPPPADRSDKLQSLLASIKHELKNAAQI